MKADLETLRRLHQERVGERKQLPDNPAPDNPQGRIAVTRANLPSKADVLYVEPMETGQRHNCKSCRFWKKPTTCALLPKDAPVTALTVCGYWCGEEPLEPKLVGLVSAPEGAACDVCAFYEPQTLTVGLCHAVTSDKEGSYASVRPRACCSRWRRK